VVGRMDGGGPMAKHAGGKRSARYLQRRGDALTSDETSPLFGQASKVQTGAVRAATGTIAAPREEFREPGRRTECNTLGATTPLVIHYTRRFCLL
jgi:hypothetical protein